MRLQKTNAVGHMARAGFRLSCSAAVHRESHGQAHGGTAPAAPLAEEPDLQAEYRYALDCYQDAKTLALISLWETYPQISIETAKRKGRVRAKFSLDDESSEDMSFEVSLTSSGKLAFSEVPEAMENLAKGLRGVDGELVENVISMLKAAEVMIHLEEIGVPDRG